MFTLLAVVKKIWNYSRRISDAYNRHFGGLMAAAVSFFALLSIVPLLSVGVAILGLFVGGSDTALWEMKGSVQRYLPANDSMILGTLQEIKRDKGLLGVLGLLGLLLSGSAIFTNMEIAFNNVWGVKEMRHWFHQRLVAIGTSLVTIALLFGSILVTSVLTYIQNAPLPGFGYHASQIPYFSTLTGYLSSYLLSITMFAVLYKIVPNKPIQWREAFIGGLFSGVAWEVAKYAFAFYLARFANYNKVYGSLGGLIILMVWTYYSMTILFLGAEVAADVGTKLPAADAPIEGMPHPPEADEGVTR